MGKQRLVGIGLAAVMAPFALGGPALADNLVNTGYFGGVAINGYDPVAYFTEGKPVKGSDKFAYDWLGTPWHFASDKHRQLFQSEPVKYAPQYGGYCVGEVAADDVTINVDPDGFRIIDGKLYLGYTSEFMDVVEANPQDWLPKAEANWPKVKAKLEKDEFH